MARFTPDFLDELKSRLRPSDVIGRSVTLKRQGNEFAGLSPFTKEKTPSFFVNDQKGFYHCFSSGKHGDIISFLQETQNLQFHEAVAMLAADAGLELPKDNPAEARREEARKGLVEACEAAAVYFTAMLGREPGRLARDYLRRREVTQAQIKEFGLGFAPADRTGLKDTLINKGFSEEILGQAGLLIRPDQGASYDKFRDRVMFPIKNPRGQVIAFGGRALSADAKAKYMNSPETPLFHKSSVLYRFGEARKATGGSAGSEKFPLIVCEGYMDVLALWGGGLTTGVAPLGTALTEDQLAMLWRVSDEPILSFDGDKAGRRAAYRAIERALPLLKPGKSLRFAFMPDGQDPDDLIREKGRGAVEEVLNAAKPFVDVLWLREQETHDLSTPERRASFKASLRRLVKSISDKDVREFYASEILSRLDAKFGGRSQYPNSGRAGYSSKQRPGWKMDRKTGRYTRIEPVEMTAQLRALREKQAGSANAIWQREATLVLALICHPGLIERKETQILTLDLADEALRGILREILAYFSTGAGLDSDLLKSHLESKVKGKPLERLLSDRTLNSQSFLKTDAQTDEVDWGFDTALSHHQDVTNLKEELARAALRIFSRDDAEFEDGTELMKDGPGDGYDAYSSDMADIYPDDDRDPDNSLHKDALTEGTRQEQETKGNGTGNDELWKQTAAAREEAFNRFRASSRSTGDMGSENALEDALKNMKSSVSNSSRGKNR